MKRFFCGCLCLAASAAVLAEGLILTTEEAPPTNFSLDGGKTITGSATEQIREMMQRAGVTYSISMFPWKRAYAMAESDKNTCVYATTRTPEREAKFHWIGPVAPNDWMLFVKADSTVTVKNLDEAKKFRVGGYRGDAEAEFLEAQGFKMDNAGDNDQALKKLVDGRIDIMATGMLDGPWAAKKLGVRIKPILNFKATELHLACNKSVPTALVDKLNATLKAMEKDGTTAAINKKYQ